MRLSYVLPDPSSYSDRREFDGDLACMKQAGYDAVELQIADPADLDIRQVEASLDASGLEVCAFQTGSTYYTCHNCLCTGDDAVRRRTMDLLHAFVALGEHWNSVVVFGSLQGRLTDEPDRAAGAARILDAVAEVGRFASDIGATIAFEPVQHGEVGFHNTIAEVAQVVRSLGLPGVKMMVDTFHMNIEERDMLEPLSAVGDILAHVHLSETNRDVLGTGHWPTAPFLDRLEQVGYGGYCSVGVYNTRLERRECISRCMSAGRRREL